MELYDLIFYTLSLAGIWRKNLKSYPVLFKIHPVYSLIVAPMPHLLLIAMINRLLFKGLNFDEAIENVLLILPVTNVVLKSYNFFRKRDQLEKLMRALHSFRYESRDDAVEKSIRNEHKSFIRFLSLLIYTLVATTLLAWLAIPFFQAPNNRTMPFPIWIPGDYLTDKIFWRVYIFEAISISMVCCVALANDCLILIFFMFLCEEMVILSHQLKCIPQKINNYQHACTNDAIEKEMFKKVIKQHLRLYDLVDLTQRTFNAPINGQFITSFFVVSINIYLLTTFKTLSIHCLSVLLYLICMLVEFLIYCWSGNEITINHEKFRNSVFLMNWTKLNLKSRKGLILIAARTVRPIVMSRNSIMDLSLNTFLKVLKLSYSAFNVIRRAT